MSHEPRTGEVQLKTFYMEHLGEWSWERDGRCVGQLKEWAVYGLCVVIVEGEVIEGIGAGDGSSGGWGYRCPCPFVDGGDEARGEEIGQCLL